MKNLVVEKKYNDRIFVIIKAFLTTENSIVKLLMVELLTTGDEEIFTDRYWLITTEFILSDKIFPR